MDLYKAPDAQVSLPAETPSRPVRGIVLGAVADLVVSTLLFIVYALVMGIYMANQGATENQIAQFFMSFEQSGSSMIASYVIGGTGSALGGYISARYSRVHEYRYGSVLVLIMASLSVFFESDVMLLASGVALTCIATYAGIYWGVLRNAQDAGGS